MENETWKDIPNYVGGYQISNYGRVKTLKRRYIKKNGIPITINEKLRKAHVGKRGYWTVQLKFEGRARQEYIHRLMAVTFLDNPRSKKEVNHINGIKTDNSISNLEWSTHKENMSHAKEAGLYLRTTHRKDSKLDDIKLLTLYTCIGKYTNAGLALHFNMRANSISRIKCGRKHKAFYRFYEAISPTK